MTAAKRGRSALSRYLAERAAQRNAERDRPDASAAPVEERPVPEAAPESKPEPKVAPEPAPKPARASKAAKKAKWQDLAGTPIKVVKPSKLNPYIDKIGVLTDAEVARMAGVTPTNVQLWRRRRGIPPAKVGKAKPPVAEPSVALARVEPAPLVFVEAPDPVLEPAPVEVPAPEPVPTPPSSKPSKLTPYADKIGVLSDAEVAGLAGVTRDAVWKWRQRRGIPPATAGKAVPPVVETLAPVEHPEVPEPVEPQVEPMKREPAPIVFLEAPVPVQKPAPVLEAAPVESPAPEPFPAPPTTKRKRGRPSKVDQYGDKIGVVPDEELAALAGVAVTTVQRWRKVKGIAAPVVEEAVEPAVVEPLPAPVAEEPQPVEPVPAAGTAARTVRLTDRVEGMLKALAKVRGIDTDAAIAVAIAEDYLRCSVLMGKS